MKDLADAHRLRTHVIGCLETADVTDDPEVKQQLLTFVVVGAGFSGVETVAEVRELVRRALKYYHEHQARRDSLLPDRICRPHPADLPGRPRRIRDAAPQHPRHRGADRRRHQIGDRHRRRADRRHASSRPATIVATIGNGPHPLVATLDLDMQWGRIKTDRFMRVPGHDGVWALGDAALIPLVEHPGEDPADYATADRAVRGARRAPARRQHHRQDRGRRSSSPSPTPRRARSPRSA